MREPSLARVPVELIGGVREGLSGQPPVLPPLALPPKPPRETDVAAGQYGAGQKCRDAQDDGVLAVAAVLAMTTAIPANAITGDYVKDNEHPFVGLIVFYSPDGAFHHRCSGSLLTPTVFLTAGHCTAGASSARVYFQQDAGVDWSAETGSDPDTGYPNACAEGTAGTLCAMSHEMYNYGFTGLDTVPETKDAGLVILEQPIMLDEYARLAAPGTLDALAAKRGQQETTFTASGYGFSEVNPVSLTSFRERLMAESRLTNLASATNDGYNIQTNGNGNSHGGTCTGTPADPCAMAPSIPTPSPPSPRSDTGIAREPISPTAPTGRT